MLRRVVRRWAWWLLAAMAVEPALTQTSAVQAQQPSSKMLASGSPAKSVKGWGKSEQVREIDDPDCGIRWLLLRNESNPGGPGRLVMAGIAPGGKITGKLAGNADESTPKIQKPVILAGDHLVVEQETADMRARLEAIALLPAPVGKRFRVRLLIDGKVLDAVALAPGLAVLKPEAMR